jgi:histidine triad (HIT) family protein
LISTELEVCAFCAIARGDDPSVELICEGKAWVAFFPLDPATPGHTLVAPRRHLPDLWEADAELGAELMAAVIRVGRAIRVALAPEGMNLITSAGDAAEQTVFHLHLHVLPRWHEDGMDRIWPLRSQRQRSDPHGLADRVRRACQEVRDISLR